MPSSLSRLQEVLTDLLAYHPSAKLSGCSGMYSRNFCASLQRRDAPVSSVRAMFDGDDAVFTIITQRAEDVYKVYDDLRFGLQTFFLSSDYGLNPQARLVHYRLRKVRDTCRRGGPADIALVFNHELASVF